MSKTQIKGTNYGQIVNNNVDSHVKSNQEKFTFTLESGKSAITLNGGMEYPIMFKEVLAGEYIKDWKIDNITRLITPLVPTLDKVYVTIKAFFVPHTRVWKNAELALAQKASSVSPYLEQSYSIPNYTVPQTNTNYDMFRNSLLARYGMANYAGDTKVNALLFRGYRAIYNDYIINKEYENPKIEWDTDTVTTAEQDAIKGYNTASGTVYPNAYYIEASQTRKGYLTNVFSTLNSDLESFDDYESGNPYRFQHLEWEQKYKNAKQNILNANKNDWDIIGSCITKSPCSS